MHKVNENIIVCTNFTNVPYRLNEVYSAPLTCRGDIISDTILVIRLNITIMDLATKIAKLTASNSSTLTDRMEKYEQQYLPDLH